MLAEMGYTALALDMYGEGKRAEHPEDAQKFAMEVMQDAEAAVARFEAARALLEAHGTTDPERTAAIGYCFGGAVVLRMARRGMDLDGVASFHGSLPAATDAQAQNIRSSVYVAHGEADAFVPADRVEAFKSALKGAGVDLQFVVFQGARHSFTVPEADTKGIENLRYDADADQASWAQLTEFLDRVFE